MTDHYLNRGFLRRFWLVWALWLAPAAALAAGAMGFDEARHLLNRTGFAATVDEVSAYASRSREQAVDRLLGETRQEAVTSPPAWVADHVAQRRVRAMGEEERRAFLRDQREKGVELRSWWLSEMLTTPSPLTERMVLFWHNHFVSSLQKVRWPSSMYRQHTLLRRHAFGNFRDFLHEIARDPAMVVYLDSASNRKGQPNENFAREVMELFTLGEGHYTEQDVKEAARAFTGWSIDLDTGEFMFRPLVHDDGAKTVLGRTGNFDGAAVLDILLAQPQTAEFIVAKLWREFVSSAPDAGEVRRIAGLFRNSRYDIKVALRELLVADAFYAPQHRAVLVKSPVELIVGTLRQFGFKTGAATPFALASRQLGQDLFAPPNVKGWPGGEQWINSATLLARKHMLEQLFAARVPGPAMATAVQSATPAMSAGAGAGAANDRFVRALRDIHFDGPQWLSQFRAGDELLVRVVLPAEPFNGQIPGLQGTELLRQLVLDPVYQLK